VQCIISIDFCGKRLTDRYFNTQHFYVNLNTNKLSPQFKLLITMELQLNLDVMKGRETDSCNIMKICQLGCVSLRKSKIGFFNPKESENGFCVSLLNRLI